MKPKYILIAAVAASIAGGVITTTSPAAENSATAGTRWRGQGFKRMAERLNLTAGQKAEIKSILDGEKDTLKNLCSRLHDARKELRAAIQGRDANESSVRAAAAKAASTEADWAVERMKLFGKISPVLTDEQRQKISELAARADDFADRLIARIGEGLAE